MPSDHASNVTEKRQPVRKKPRLSSKPNRTSTPNAYARRSPPRERSPAPITDDDERSRSRSRSPPRKLKRPGAGARFGAADKAAADAARRRREEEERAAASSRQQPTATGLVASHYNAVPEWGREWRKTDSQIKGLRSLNNWVKSTLIQKFSRPETPTPELCVLDMACGKGGDLGKWEKAPQTPALYVGCDIADISIDQARQRWDETLRKSRGRTRMRAEFHVHDAFGKPLFEIPRIREVGFNPNAGPGGGVIQGGMMTGGFDVVSIMFALHYSYESERLARSMLKNISGALKKGGRFIGVMPNSDVISATVKKLLQAEITGQTPNGKEPSAKEGGEEGEIEEEDDNWDPERPSEPNGTTSDDEWDPEKPSEPQPALSIDTKANGDGDEDDWNPEEASEPAQTAAAPIPETNGTSPAVSSESDLPPLEWGNHLYTVRFPRNQPLNKLPLPKDGIFRPPYGWRYHYQLEEAVDVPEYVVPWEGFRALAEEYGLELMYRKGFREVFEDESEDKDLGMLAERMGVMSRDRSEGKNGLLVGDDEMAAASFYHAFCFYKT